MRIMRVVGSRLLPCGCFVGKYEAFSGAIEEIVDERGPRCEDHRHAVGRVLPRADPATRQNISAA